MHDWRQLPQLFDRLFCPGNQDGVKSEEMDLASDLVKDRKTRRRFQNADSATLLVKLCDDSVLFGNRNGTDCQLFVTDCNIHEDVVTAHQAVLEPEVLYAQWHRQPTKFCDVEVRSFRANEWLAEAMVVTISARTEAALPTLVRYAESTTPYKTCGLNKLCCRAFGIRHGLALLKEGRAFVLQQSLTNTANGSGFAF